MIFHLIKHLGWRSNFFKHKASSLEPIISSNFAKHCFSNVSVCTLQNHLVLVVKFQVQLGTAHFSRSPVLTDMLALQ